MKLNHVTHRKNCEAILAQGFRDGRRQEYGVGVYLTPEGTIWYAEEPLETSLFLPRLHPNLVVIAVDMPVEVARKYAEMADDGTVFCYCVPAQVLNDYPIELIHWKGDSPVIGPAEVESPRGGQGKSSGSGEKNC